MNELQYALQHVEQAAGKHQSLATQCQALAGLIKSMKQPSDEPMPVETLAKSLLPFDLCIVHRNVVRDALDIVQQTDDAEGLSGDDLRRLERRLNAALNGSAT